VAAAARGVAAARAGAHDHAGADAERAVVVHVDARERRAIPAAAPARPVGAAPRWRLIQSVAFGNSRSWRNQSDPTALPAGCRHRQCKGVRASKKKVSKDRLARTAPRAALAPRQRAYSAKYTRSARKSREGQVWTQNPAGGGSRTSVGRATAMVRAERAGARAEVAERRAGAVVTAEPAKVEVRAGETEKASAAVAAAATTRTVRSILAMRGGWLGIPSEEEGPSFIYHPRTNSGNNYEAWSRTNESPVVERSVCVGEGPLAVLARSAGVRGDGPNRSNSPHICGASVVLRGQAALPGRQFASDTERQVRGAQRAVAQGPVRAQARRRCLL
jgi:hypothetical protein